LGSGNTTVALGKGKGINIMVDVTIYYEDCIKGMLRIEDESIDEIIADPPFGIGFSGKEKGNYNRDPDNVISGYNEIAIEDYRQFSYDWMSEAKRILKPYGTMYVFSSRNRMFDVRAEADNLRLYQHAHLTWARTFPAYRRWSWVDSIYHIFMFLKYVAPETGSKGLFHTFNKIETPNPRTGKLRHYARCDLRFPEVYLRGQKKNETKLPTSLVEYLILTSSNEGDTVVDPFMGNGTTAAASILTKRKCIGFEINPDAREVIDLALKQARADCLSLTT
jgi:DNA modification methylase